jgi:hypothetical protein
MLTLNNTEYTLHKYMLKELHAKNYRFRRTPYS